MKTTDTIWHNGDYKPWAEATTHVMSHALHYGSSVFEGIRVYETPDGPTGFRLSEHIDRLMDSARIYRMPVPWSRDEIIAACHQLVVANELESAYLRPILLRGFGSLGVVAGPEAGVNYAGKHGYPCVSDTAIADTRAEDFDGLLLPGGFSPDKLRRDAHVLDLTRSFDADAKLIAFICHSGWIPISANILRGRKATGTVGIKDDLVNAGAEWVDAPLVVDGHLISSRTPKDLHVFGKAVVDWLQS